MSAPSRRRAALVLSLQVVTRGRRLPALAQMRRWTRAVLKHPAQVCFRIVGEREGESLNRRYRGKAHATNVLSFRYGAAQVRLAGDIVMCAPVIAREARAQRKALEAHYAHLTVHGLLHLQGYDHDGPRKTRIMETMEIAILKRLGYANPYAGEG